MRDPIKIIHKFKNNKGKIIYIPFIFIGGIVPKNVYDILVFIDDLDFFTTLDKIKISEYQIMENFYGEFWYNFFFIKDHIKYQINIIKESKTQKTAIIKKYEKKWYEKHINNPLDDVKKYSYISNHYDTMSYKNLIYLKNTNDSNKLKQTSQIGGDDNDDDDVMEKDDYSEDNNFDNDMDVYDEPDNIIENSFNLDELTNIYRESYIENEKDTKNTTKLINDILQQEKNKLNKNIIEYIDKYDNLKNDMELYNITDKYYITNQYIYKNDTIENIKKKICLTIPTSPIFKNIKILPETQYIWSKYNYLGNIEKVIIGYKWLYVNELLDIDVEPSNNITTYLQENNKLSLLYQRYNYKLKREDNNDDILNDYSYFITNNELYLLDIFNELKTCHDISDDSKKRLAETYLKIYFPLINKDSLDEILNVINNNNNDTLLKNTNLKVDNINNELKIENDIMNIFEKYKQNNKIYDKYFEENNIIQTIIYVKIKDIDFYQNISYKIDLYRIFNNFIVNDEYPFLQYKTEDSNKMYKYYSDDKYLLENKKIIEKWFENISYGLSFKIKIDRYTDIKHIFVNLHESGNMEYRITWKETDKVTTDKIKDTYDYIIKLVEKINNENTKIKLVTPTYDNFSFAFINSILKFNLPNNYIINHDDLSDFCRYFYMFVSLIIEPKKRVKVNNINDNVSKYGTYLRYKRIGKFDSKHKIHIRIIYLLRNYDINESELLKFITKQFNTTIDIATKELNFVKQHYKKIISKKIKKIKNINSIPKFKLPGIGIDIQGKDKDNYKIRITGARNEEQLDDIITFVKVLLYMYVETYLHKNVKFQPIKEKLIEMVNIAKRLNKVTTIVNYENTDESNIKSSIILDKTRLGFKPNKGKNQWSRLCQNSGEYIRKRPDVIPDSDLSKLIKKGYSFNNKTGYYEKEMIIDKNRIVTKAIKLPSDENTFNYFACNKQNNGEYLYPGFLSKGNNSDNLCMPCCFKKDQGASNNVKKRNYYYTCLGKLADKNIIMDDDVPDVSNNKIYILKESDRIQDKKFVHLIPSMDILFNKIVSNTYVITKHYLDETDGYFFKYTVSHTSFHFLITISDILNISIDDIKKKCIKYILNDKNDIIFTYLNNGNIRHLFLTREKFINYIKTSDNLEYDTIGELISIPGVLTDNGINFYILNKLYIIIKNQVDKDDTLIEYNIDCLNSENINLLREPRDTIILLCDDIYYSPIYHITKKINIVNIRKFYTEKNDKKILDELYKYYTFNCNKLYLNNLIKSNNLSAKNLVYILKLNKINIVSQIIDNLQYKCKYIVLENIIIPVKYSGINLEYGIVFNIPDSKLLSLYDTIKELNILEKKISLEYKPISVIFDKKDKDNIFVKYILLQNSLYIPVKNEFMSEKKIKENNLSVSYQNTDDIVDDEILKNNKTYDIHAKNINEKTFKTESYNLLRLETSFYLSKNKNVKKKLVEIVRGIEPNDIKRHEIKEILFNIFNKKLTNKIDNSIKEHDINITNKNPDLKNYVPNNILDTCNILPKTKCSENIQCEWLNNKCTFSILKEYLIDFLNRLTEEFFQNSIKFQEIINENEYYVTDIVNKSVFTLRKNQQIIKINGFKINNKGIDTTIKKKNTDKRFNIIQIDETPKMIYYNDYKVQEIIPNNDTVLRGYINSYFWINNKLYKDDKRNLGYNSELQTKLTFILKSNINDFITYLDKSRDTNYYNLTEYIITKYNTINNPFEYIINNNINNINNNIIIDNDNLLILSYIIKIPIILFDNYYNIISIYLQGPIKVTEKSINNFRDFPNYITLKFDIDNSAETFNKLYSLYY